jgi:hypothetical protein
MLYAFSKRREELRNKSRSGSLSAVEAAEYRKIQRLSKSARLWQVLYSRCTPVLYSCRAHTVLILYSYCTHTVLILYSCCTHTVLIHYTLWQDRLSTEKKKDLGAVLVLILYSYCTHTVPILCLILYCTRTVLIPYCTHTVLSSCPAASTRDRGLRRRRLRAAGDVLRRQTAGGG